MMRVAVLLLLVLGPVLRGQPVFSPVTARHGMVVSAEPHATRAGVEILAAGGNAVDAACAVGFALAVTLPRAGNLGGGGFMVVHLPGREDMTIDYRETGPARAHRDLYLGKDGKAIAALSTRGHLAAGTPGSVAGLLEALAYGGSLPRATILAPAIRLAREGFAVSESLAASLNGAKFLDAYPESRRIFRKGGERWAASDLLVQPELARTLELIAEHGREGFYGGVVAQAIVEEMALGSGIMTKDDLAGYQVRFRRPVVGTYRGYEVVSMPPPSSGGVALIQMLNALEGFPITRLGPGAEQTLHLTTEAMRFAFHDRARFLGDPDFTEVPTQGLISKDHAADGRTHFRDVAGDSSGMVSLTPPKESMETTHYSVMDKSGMAVACTTTLNGSYGSGVTVTGAGFLLNNEMDDFAAAPGEPNMYGLVQGEANSVGPKKRPLSSMTPTLVKRDGQVCMVIGSPGGPTIINTVLQCIMNVIDHEMDIARAIAAPRIHHQWLPDRLVYERFGLNPDVERGLRARGHALEERRSLGNAQGITFDPESGTFAGSSDPRGSGLALGF